MAHTEAPWKFDEKSKDVVSEDGSEICNFNYSDQSPNIKEDIALVVAAPNLLKALMLVASAMETGLLIGSPEKCMGTEGFKEFVTLTNTVGMAIYKAKAW
jgi:hypothetical protein